MHLRIAKSLQWVFRSVKAWSEGVGPLYSLLVSGHSMYYREHKIVQMY